MSLSQKSGYLILPEDDVKPLTPYKSEAGADFLDYVEVLVRHRWVIAAATLLGVLIACSLSFLEDEVYRAETVILPVEQTEYLHLDRRRSAARRTFFEEILQSPPTHRRVFEQIYQFEEDGVMVSGDLSSLLQIDSVQEGIELLGDAVDVDGDRSGAITIGTEIDSPALAAAIANEYVEQLRAYYDRRREGQSREQIQFIQDRIAEIRAEMDEAQNDLVEFRRHNLDVVGGMNGDSVSGPRSERGLEFERLGREVEIRSTLLATVMNRYEAAKIRSKGESSRFEVLSLAEPPEFGSRTGMATLAAIGLAVGLFAGISISFIRDYVRRKSADGRLDAIIEELQTERILVQRLVHWLRPRRQAATDDEARSVAQA